MKWASGLTRKRNLAVAVEEVTDALLRQLGGAPPALVAAFISPHYQDSFEDLPDLIHDRLAPGVFLGCSASGVIGGGAEVEQQPALAVVAAHLPGVAIEAFHLELDGLPGPDDGPSAWVETMDVHPRPTPHFVLLADPFSFDPTDLLRGLDFAYPGSATVGGLASGSSKPEEPSLFLGREVHASGAVGVALQGNIRMETVVAQGCRPIGTPMVVTRCEGHLLMEVDGRNPIEVLVALYNDTTPRDQRLMQTALLVGVASTELRETFGPGDFLIRPLRGMDQRKGVIAVNETLRNGQTIQFHVRDAETAMEDLELMLDRYRAGSPGTPAAGAFLFSCQGRGENLFGRPNHDSEAFVRSVGEVPFGGFFCGGEIGPVGASTYVHGFTSSFGIFRPTVGGT